MNTEKRIHVHGTLLSLMLLFFAQLCFGAASVSAGTVFSADVVGLSKDGKYMAYTVSASLDMSGFTSARLFILDVHENDFAHYGEERIFRGEEWVEPEEAVSEILKEKSDLIDGFGIDSELRGEEQFWVEEGVIAGEIARPCSIDFRMRDYPYLAQRYRLELSVRSVNDSDCEQYIEPEKPKIFTLTLLGPSREVRTVLQEDRLLYESRRCPLDYAISRVITYRNGLVVFLNSFTFNIEGPDARKLVVSGRLP